MTNQSPYDCGQWPPKPSNYQIISNLRAEIDKLKNELVKLTNVHYAALCDGCASGLDIVTDFKYPEIPMHNWPTLNGTIVSQCKAYKLRLLKNKE